MNTYRLFSQILFLLLTIEWQQLSAQCTPPQAETCEEASVLCSLDELNNYACNNPSTVPSPCSPLCSQGGVGHNTSWWAFVCKGGSICITLTAGSCSSNQGLQYGIWGDCVCGEEIICRSIPCIPPNSVSVACGDVVPCKTYYFWVDGCSGDICDFTINTTGDLAPSLVPLGLINNIPNKVIKPVCVGACNVPFFVNHQPGGCLPTYVWTLDGNEVAGNDNEVYLGFPKEGDFVICVTAYIGNPQSGSICSQEGPQCATVEVRPIPNTIGINRVLCFEQAQPSGYKWHSQKITQSGIYREQFTDANCCKFDSIVEFTVLPSPLKKEIFYISCDSTPYKDLLGRTYFPCKNKYEIILTQSTDLYKCDSSIILTAVNVDYKPNWNAQCMGDLIEISSNVNIVNSCNAGESYQYAYRWYRKDDSSKTTLSTNDRILVKPINVEYCLEVKVRTQLQTKVDTCTKMFFETIKESDFISFAGNDFKVKSLNTKLNASNAKKGSWKIISGSGKVNFQNINDAKTRISVDKYGLYCFEWTINDMSCYSKDTVCVTFFKIKTTTPDFPHKMLDDRDVISGEEENNVIEIFTPNLISNAGNSYFTVDGEIYFPIHYFWYNNTGKNILNKVIFSEPGMERLDINSPLQAGFYYLIIELNNLRFIRKVCVI